MSAGGLKTAQNARRKRVFGILHSFRNVSNKYFYTDILHCS